MLVAISLNKINFALSFLNGVGTGPLEIKNKIVIYVQKTNDQSIIVGFCLDSTQCMSVKLHKQQC